MVYSKEEAYENDHCIYSRKHRIDIIYDGKPMCDECYDKETDKLVEDFKRRMN